MSSPKPVLSSWLPPPLREGLRASKLAVARPVSGRRHGRHRSSRAGLGLDFRDHRIYAPGDDMRRLDWRAIARRERLILRQTESEDEQSIAIVLDDSGGMAYGEGEHDKATTARAYAAGLAWLGLRQGDPCGLAIGRDGLAELTLARPSSSPERERALARAMNPAPGGHCPWISLLEQVAARLPRRTLLFVVSDFLDPGEPGVASDQADDNLQRALVGLRARRHDVVLVQIVHRDELEFPWRERKTTRFVDLRGLHADIEGAVDAMRQSYLARLEEHLQRLHRVCERDGLLLHRHVTDEPLADGFLGLLARLAGRPVAATSTTREVSS